MCSECTAIAEFAELWDGPLGPQEGISRHHATTDIQSSWTEVNGESIDCAGKSKFREIDSLKDLNWFMCKEISNSTGVWLGRCFVEDMPCLCIMQPRILARRVRKTGHTEASGLYWVGMPCVHAEIGVVRFTLVAITIFENSCNRMTSLNCENTTCCIMLCPACKERSYWIWLHQQHDARWINTEWLWRIAYYLIPFLIARLQTQLQKAYRLFTNLDVKP